MNPELAQPIADFFSAEEQRDTDAMSRCFAEDAIVQDEGRSIRHAYRYRAVNGEFPWQPCRP